MTTTNAVSFLSLRLLASSALVLGITAVAALPACGQSAGTSSVRVPTLHRASALACPHVRSPGSVVPLAGMCKSDADCTAGANGRCLDVVRDAPGRPEFASRCSYDECFADAECGAGTCACRPPGSALANACVAGNCKVDADCGGNGYCSPSASSVFTYSYLPAADAQGFWCHTPDDACTDDADCNDAQSFGLGLCVHDLDVGHWKCTAGPGFSGP